MSKSNNLKKLNKIKIKYCLILLILATVIGLLYNFLPTFTRYYAEVFFNAIGYAKTEHEITYSIHFDPNTGTGSMDDFQMTFNHPANLPEGTFTKDGYLFLGWNTEAAGGGTNYEDEQQVNNLVNVDNGSITLYAQWEEIQGVAKVNGVYYPTLQEAIDVVPTDNTETTVRLVADVAEHVTVSSGQKILFNLKGHTISNSTTTPIITNNGYITITNGAITASSTIAQGVINNNQNANLIVTGGRITTEGTKQAIYNDKGLVEISGTAYLSNTASERPVVQNQASSTLRISGGTIVASKYYGVENKASGTITITGGSISSSSRMAFVNGGTATISGGTFTADYNYCLQNSGDLTITGGSIINARGIGINNQDSATNLTIGTKDGNVSKTEPLIQGKTYGLSSNTSSFNFYDGTIIGNTPLSSATLQNLNETEEGYTIITVPEMIDGIQYKSAHLGKTCTITFDPTLGTLSDDQINSTVEIGEKIAELPLPTSLTHTFDGWFTEEDGGTQITENTIITQETTFYAHWHQEQVARINDTIYTTLQAAVGAVPKDNTLTTIVLLADVHENVEIEKNQNIQFNLQDHTITNATNNPVLNNKGGTIRISNGTITSTASSYAVIDNKIGGNVIITGGTINGNGGRQALYIESGATAEISGTAYLSSSAPERAAVHNLAGGHLTILGGTIISTSQQAVKNEGSLVLGLQDGTANENSPILQGTTFGLTNDNISLQGNPVMGTYSFYGGTVKGLTGAIDTNPANLETGYDVQITTESGYEVARLVQHVEEPEPDPDPTPDPTPDPEP